MIKIIIVLVLVAVAGWVVYRRGHARALDYVPAETPVVDSALPFLPRDGTALPSPDQATGEIIERETVGDASDDLLDPSNPHHKEWVHEHPEEETDYDRTVEGEGDAAQ